MHSAHLWCQTVCWLVWQTEPTGGGSNVISTLKWPCGPELKGWIRFLQVLCRGLIYSLHTPVETAGLPVCVDMRELVFEACTISVWEKVRLKRLPAWWNERFHNSCPGLIRWRIGRWPSSPASLLWLFPNICNEFDDTGWIMIPVVAIRTLHIWRASTVWPTAPEGKYRQLNESLKTLYIGNLYTEGGTCAKQHQPFCSQIN